MNIKKSQLKQIIKETISDIIRSDVMSKTKKSIEENRWAANNPEGNREFGGGIPSGGWSDLKKVEELKKSLYHALEAGNFDEAHKLVDNLAAYYD